MVPTPKVTKVLRTPHFLRGLPQNKSELLYLPLKNSLPQKVPKVRNGTREVRLG